MDNATIASITGVIAPWKKRLNKITRTTCNTYAKKLKKKQWYNNRPWAQKRIFWTFEKGIFQVFANFWVMKLKPFSGKVRQSVQNYLNQNLIIGSFLKNGIEATWNSNECSDRLKRTFFSFLQIFEWRRWNRFLGKRDNSAKIFSIKSTLLRAI